MIALDDADSIRRFLKDPSGPAIPDVEYMAAQWDSDSIPAATKGLAGLFLLCAAAEASIAERAPSLQPPNEYLKDASVQRALLSEYEVNPHVLTMIDKLQYHRPGTTSIILRSGSTHVLKIIKPWFWDVASIARATAAYRTEFGDLGSRCPTVVDSDKKWIFMTYIQGRPLTEYIRKDLHPLPDDPNTMHLFLSQVQDIFTEICDALIECAQFTPPIHHLDLSPDNIMVEGSRGKVRSVRLLDFGVNSLLLTHLRNDENVLRASVFVPPELQEGAQGDSLSDIYSLGLILLEMLAPASLSGTDVGGALDDVWIGFPQIAANVEDMIDRDPKNRLLQTKRRESGPFSSVSESVVHSMNLHRKTELKPRSILDVPVDIVNSTVPIKSVVTAWKNYQDCLQDCDQAPLLWVFLWVFAAQILHIVVIFLIVWTSWKFPDNRLCDLINWCAAGKNVPPLPFWDGALGGTINGFTPGRLMALTSALIFSKYYAEVVALITVRYLRSDELRRHARVPEVAMRSVPVLGFLPLLYGLVVDPKAWPFCASFGLLVASANNQSMYRFFRFAQRELFGNGKGAAPAGLAEKATAQACGRQVDKALASVKLGLPWSQFVDDQLYEFERWHTGLRVYATSLFVLGICMLKGVAKDEWLYAVLAGLFVNMGVIYRIHCWIRPPLLRTTFARIVFRLRMVDKALEKSANVTVGAVKIEVADV
ncbi:MAG: protein kinase [Bryobacteraceae bacterium]